MVGLSDLMATMACFVEQRVGGLRLWEARLGNVEVLVAEFPDGEISVTRQVDEMVPLIVRFNRFDPGILGLLCAWVAVRVS